MAKEQPKVHLIEDKTIGGVKREYEEVRREVAVGDSVWLVNAECAIKVTEHSVDVANRQIITGDTKALDPTDIVVIEGPDGTSRYQLAERKAVVGEKVLVVAEEDSFDMYEKGDVVVAIGVNGFGIFSDNDNGDVYIYDGDYHVLIPVESGMLSAEELCGCLDEQPTPDIHDLLANLAHRVTSLERITGELVRAKSSLESQLRDTQNNVQTFAEQTESNTKDIAFLDERTEEPKKSDKPLRIMSFSTSHSFDGTTGVELEFVGTPTAKNIAEAVAKVLGGGAGE